MLAVTTILQRQEVKPRKNGPSKAVQQASVACLALRWKKEGADYGRCLASHREQKSLIEEEGHGHQIRGAEREI